MDTNKQPGISFEAIFLKELNFSRKEHLNDPKVEIKFNCDYTTEKDKATCELSCEVTDKNESLKLNCSMIGLFSIIHGQENMDLNQFLKVNAPALIFPYIRELISNTTVRAGLNPIIFPPMNIHSMLENSNNNEISKPL